MTHVHTSGQPAPPPVWSPLPETLKYHYRPANEGVVAGKCFSC
jgi:hypothetical protein